MKTGKIIIFNSYFRQYFILLLIYIVVVFCLFNFVVNFKPFQEIPIAYLNSLFPGKIQFEGIKIGITSANFNNITLSNSRNCKLLTAGDIKITYNPLLVFKYREPLACLKTLKINDFNVYIQKDSNGVWNWRYLFSQDIEKLNLGKLISRFKGKFQIQADKIEIIDPVKNFNTSFSDLFFNFSDGKFLNFELVDDFNNKKVSANGRVDTLTGFGNLNLKLSSMDYSNWVNYFSEVDFIKCLKAKASGEFEVSLYPDNPKNISDVKIDLNSNCKLDCIIKVKNIPDKLAFTVIGDINTTSFIINKLACNYKECNIAAKGTVFDFKDPYIKAQVEIQKLDIADIIKLYSALLSEKNKKNLKTISTDGVLSGSINIKGKVKNPMMIFHLLSNEISFNGSLYEDIGLIGQYYNNSLFFKKISLFYNGSNLEIQGWVFDLDKPKFALLGDVGNFNLSPIFNFPNALSGGNLGAGGVLLGDAEDPLFIGRIHLNNLIVAQGGNFSGGGAFSYDKNGIITSSLSFNSSNNNYSPGSLYVFPGFIDVKDRQLNFSFIANNLFLPNVSLGNNMPLSISTNFFGKVWGGLDSVNFMGGFNNSEIGYSGLRVNDMAGVFYGNRKMISVPYVSFGFNGGRGIAFNNLFDISKNASNINISISNFVPIIENLPGNIKMSKFKPLNLALNFVGNPSNLAFYTSSIKGGSTNIVSSGFMQNENLTAFLKLNPLCIPETKFEENNIKIKVLGDIIGQVLLGGNLKNLSVYSYLDLKKFKLGDLTSDFALTGFTRPGSDIFIDDLFYKGKGFLFNAGGKFTQGKKMDILFSSSFSNITETLAKLLNSKTLDFDNYSLELNDFGGRSNISGRLFGNIFSPIAKIDFQMHDGWYYNYPVQLLGKISYIAGVVGFYPINLKSNGGEINFRGNLNTKTNFLFSRMDIYNMDLSSILSVSPFKNLPIDGSVSGYFWARGNYKNLAFDSDLNIKRVMLFNNNFNSADISFATQDDYLVLNKLNFQGEDFSVLGNGKVNNKSKDLNFHFESTDLPLSSLVDLKRKYPDLAGTIKGSLDINGLINDPKADFQLLGDNIVFANHHFDSFSGRFLWLKNELTFAPFILNEGLSQYKIWGSILFPGGVIPLKNSDWINAENLADLPVFNLNFNTREGKMESLFTILGSPLKGRIDGDIFCNASLKGTLLKPEVSFSGRFSDGVIGTVNVKNGELDFDYNPDNFKLHRLFFETSGGMILGSGEISGNKKGAIGIEAKSLDLNIINPFLSGVPPVKGLLDLKFTLLGNMKEPYVNSELVLKNGGIGDFSFDSLIGDFIGSSGLIKIKTMKLVKQKHTTEFTGHFPLYIGTISEKDGTYPLDIRAKFKEDDLDIFNVITPVISKSSGSIDGDIRLFGTYLVPKVEGILNIKEGMLQLVDMDNPINNINLNASLKDDVLKFDKFNLTLGPGSFYAGGVVNFDKGDLMVSSFDLWMKGKDLLILYPKYFQGILGCDLTLIGSDEGALLEGSINASDSSIILPKSKSAVTQEDIEVTNAIQTNPFLAKILKNPEIKLNVGLDLDNTYLNIRTSLFNVSFLTTTSIQLGGTDLMPEILGDLEIDRGSLTIFNTPFKITGGMVSFTGHSAYNPEIAINAELLSGMNTFYLDINGTMQKPNWLLTSDPPMTQDQIIEKLAGKIMPSMFPGSSSSTSSGFQAANLAADLISSLQLRLLSPFMELLGGTLSLSEISLDMLLPGTWSITVAKALDAKEKFLITFTRVMSAQGQIYGKLGFEYRFTKRALVRFAKDSYDNFIFWIQTHYNF